MEKNNKSIIEGWAMFDWANSAYSLVISTAIFPGYFEEIYKNGVSWFGRSIGGAELFAFCVSASYLLMAFLSPILTGIADYGGKKKAFMSFFTVIGSFGCMSLWWFDSTMRWIGIFGFILATVGWLGSVVFYNSYLPDIVTEDKLDQVSAKGFSYGYVGSVLLLVCNLAMIMKFETFGFANAIQPVTLAFLTVGLWWLGFAQITLKRLPEIQTKKPMENAISKGIEGIKNVWKNLDNQPNIKRFLLSFLFYNGGVQTVIYMATIFAKKVLGFETPELITVVLILQLVGIGGAYLFANISDKKGNVFSLSITLAIWIVVCILAYFVQNSLQFYAVGGLVGLVMGGVQSLSRATYSKLIPENTPESASYFSFYDVIDKISVVMGTFIFGVVNNITGDMRVSSLTLGILFILGIVLLTRVKLKKNIA